MERLRNMSLKRALFTLALGNLLAAFVLSVLTFWGCMRLRDTLTPSDTQIIVGAEGVTETVLPEPETAASAAGNLLTVLQFLLPMLFFVAALLLTAALFYRWKLKAPLAVLSDGASRIMENDLDFTVATVSNDELGRLCAAFETMRQSLLENNRLLWRQTEERKRLNAAFSHDLRNPVTVLKGSAKLARRCAEAGNTAQLEENLDRIDTYTDRIEHYVETMSTVQRLEQLEPKPKDVNTTALSGELQKALSFAADEGEKQLIFHGLTAPPAAILLDKELLFQIVENLTANALRFARETVTVTLCVTGGQLTLTVADDGGGFPPDLLNGGVQPFHKGAEEAGHFGMGLYICDLLCRKHDGSLTLRNDHGAVACASLKIS